MTIHQKSITRAHATITRAKSNGAATFCSGIGQFDTHKNDGQDYTGITGKDIAALVQAPPNVDKDKARWFIPSDYLAHDAREHDAQRTHGRFYWLPLDVDDNNLSRQDVADAVAQVTGGARFLMYSSRSAKPDNRKWRALVPLKTPIDGQDYYDTVSAFNDLLADASEGVLIADRALQRPGQLIYLPNKGDFYESEIAKGALLDLAVSHPIIKRRDETRRQRAEADAKAREWKEWKARQPASDNSNIVDAFNAATSVADLLARYGYTRAGQSKDYRSPLQQSGSYATRDGGDFWVSLSASDAVAGIGRDTKTGQRFGDAFDLYVHFEHAGDFGDAVKSYAREIGQDYKTLKARARDERKESTGDDWERDFVLSARGHPVWNVANAALVLARHPDWKGVFAFNEFTQRRMVLRSIPGTRNGQRELSDADTTRVIQWFNKNGFPMANASVLVQVIHLTCAENAFDPLADYLNGLEWDGQSRLSSWLSTYIGAEPSAYVSEVGKRWLISAVARALKPGCKADHMLVLEGTQGKLKSTALATLASVEWFGDNLPQMGSKDAQEYLPGHWIIEAAELEAMRREVDQIKAFISRQTDRFRPAYGREVITQPRRCVFAGSTNKDDWQRDVTGGRRFWPVKVGIIDIDALKQDRNQLWAEAVALYRAKEIWWLTGDVEEAARLEVAARAATDDPWTADVLDFVSGKDEVAIVNVLAHLGFDPNERGRRDSMRVADILKEAGWQRDGKFTSGAYRTAARYVPPE